MQPYFIPSSLHFTNTLRGLEINKIYLLLDRGAQSGFKFPRLRHEKNNSMEHESYEYGAVMSTGILSYSYTYIEC